MVSVSVLTRRGLRSPYRERTLPDGRRVYFKRVAPAHELTTPPGVAVDEAVLEEAGRRGLAGIWVFRERTRENLWAPGARWQTGVRVRRGYGDQRALLWQRLDPLPRENAAQLPLFGVGP